MVKYCLLRKFRNKIFTDIDAMEKQLLYGFKYLEDNPKITKSIVAWPWIITLNSL